MQILRSFFQKNYLYKKTMATLNNAGKNAKAAKTIKRNSLWFDHSSSDYYNAMGKDYIETQTSQTVILYPVNLSKSNIDDIYGETEAQSVIYDTPIELPCTYALEKAELKPYEKKNNSALYSKSSKLLVNVYEVTLKELQCDVKIGDYVGLQVTPQKTLYYVVNNDGRSNFSAGYSFGGIMPIWRTITCSPVDPTEFNG